MSQGNKNIAIVSACGQGRTLGTKPKLIICDEVSSLSADDREALAAAQSKTLTRTGIIAEGVVPSAGALIVMAVERIPIPTHTTMAMIHGHVVPNHIIQSLRKMQESLGVESESILKLAADMAKFENGSTLGMLKKLNSSWFDPIPYDFGTMAEMFSRRNRRKKKLRQDQGKRRKRQIEKAKRS